VRNSIQRNALINAFLLNSKYILRSLPSLLDPRGHLNRGVLNRVRHYALSFVQISHNARMYLLASMLLAFGMGVQAVLYNLYLFQLGYREDVVGQVAGAVALGVAVGGLPAGLFYDRFGGKVAFSVAVITTALSLALRAVSTQLAWLLAGAALYGLANSIFFVSIFPFITEQSTARERSHLYGMNAAVWTAFMVVGSFVSGYLLRVWVQLWPGLQVIDAQRITLLGAAVLGIAAIVPIALIRLTSVNREAHKSRGLLSSRASGRSIASGALVLTLFGLVLGLVQPFYNTYFSRIFSLDTEAIGTLISLSQMMSLVSAVLVPVAVRRWGLVIGPTFIALLGTPLTLMMGLRLPLAIIAVAFLFRVGLESLSSTPLMNLLMEIVSPADRGVMSGVRLVTSYGAQAVAGAIGGWLVVGSGYGWLFGIAAVCQLLAGCSIWLLFRRREQTLESSVIQPASQSDAPLAAEDALP
jgi:MFS family permease